MLHFKADHENKVGWPKSTGVTAWLNISPLILTILPRWRWPPFPEMFPKQGFYAEGPTSNTCYIFAYFNFSQFQMCTNVQHRNCFLFLTFAVNMNKIYFIFSNFHYSKYYVSIQWNHNAYFLFTTYSNMSFCMLTCLSYPSLDVLEMVEQEIHEHLAVKDVNKHQTSCRIRADNLIAIVSAMSGSSSCTCVKW